MAEDLNAREGPQANAAAPDSRRATPLLAASAKPAPERLARRVRGGAMTEHGDIRAHVIAQELEHAA